MIFYCKRFFLKLFSDKRIIWYINGPQTLPPPLSEIEERQIFEGLENGDNTAREKMIVHNLRLVIYIAKKFENSTVNIEDLTSIGSLGLIKAVNSFKPSKNIKFATYASRCVENEILMYLRKQSNKNTDISIDDALSVDSDGNELNLIDILYTDEYEVSRNIEEESDKQILWQSIHTLPKREKEIITRRFFDGRTQMEVAEEIGISQAQVSRLEKDAINRIRKAYK